VLDVTYIDESRAVSGTQVVQYRSLIQVSQVRHVLDFLKLGRVHLLDVIFLHHFLLYTQRVNTAFFISKCVMSVH